MSFIGPTDLPPQRDPPPSPTAKPKREARDPQLPEQPPRITVEAICCPKQDCRSLKVYPRWWHTDDKMRIWQCSTCKTTWKEPAAAGDLRVAIP